MFLSPSPCSCICSLYVCKPFTSNLFFLLPTSVDKMQTKTAQTQLNIVQYDCMVMQTFWKTMEKNWFHSSIFLFRYCFTTVISFNFFITWIFAIALNFYHPFFLYWLDIAIQSNKPYSWSETQIIHITWMEHALKCCVNSANRLLFVCLALSRHFSTSYCLDVW